MLLLCRLYIFVSGVLTVGDHTFSRFANNEIDWCYDDLSCNEETWMGRCAYSGQQSPINLPGNLKSIHKLPETVKNFPKANLTLSGFSIGFKENTVQIHPTEQQSFTFTREINGSGIATYMFHGLDFHWGTMDNVGSEHTIDGRTFSAEVHLAFRQINKRKFVNENSEANGNLVIAVLLDINAATRSTETSNFLQSVVASLENLGEKSSVDVTEKLHFSDLFSGNIAYRYYGSYTTPPCKGTEWWVLRQPVAIPEKDLHNLRNANVDGNLVPGNNYRSLKPHHPNDISLVYLQYI